MTRCKEFYEKVERDGDFCGMNEDTLREVLAFIDFVEEYPDLSGISEKAGKPLIREKDPEVKAKAVEAVAKNISNGNVPTAKQVKSIIENKRAGVKPGGRIQSGSDSVPEQPTLTMEDFLSQEKNDVGDVEDPEMDMVQDYYSGDAPITPDEQEKPEDNDVQNQPVPAVDPEVKKTGLSESSGVEPYMQDQNSRVAQATKNLQKEKEDERERNEITERNENNKTKDTLVSVLSGAMKTALHEGITRKEVFEALHIAIDSVFEPIESDTERKTNGSEVTSGGCSNEITMEFRD